LPPFEGVVLEADDEFEPERWAFVWDPDEPEEPEEVEELPAPPDELDVGVAAGVVSTT
jgi:hypothetical protein